VLRGPQENENLVLLRELGVNIVECDLLNIPTALPVPEFQMLYHLAAYARTEVAQGGFAVNDIGTKNLLSWLGSSLRGVTIVYAGTLASIDYASGRSPVTEDTPCTPKTIYGQTKLRGEEIVRDYAHRFSASYIVFRLCTVIGKGFRGEGMFGLLPRSLEKQALATRLNWPGRCAFLAMSDLVDLLVRAMQEPKLRNEVFVLSNGENPSFDQVLDRMAAVLLLPRKRIILPAWMWKFVSQIAWGLASLPAPYHLKLLGWRAGQMCTDAMRVDSSRLSSLLPQSFKSVEAALQETYSPGPDPLLTFTPHEHKK
jgi:nucleoside-diphosphate-sugar epimerase